MKDFVGVFDNSLSSQQCNDVITYFEELRKYNLVFDRQSIGDSMAHEKKDETCFIFEPDTFYLDKTHPVLTTVLEQFWKCYTEYAKTYSVLLKSNKHGIVGMRIQKTQPGGGYHNWHYENNGRIHGGRFLAFIIYLNTVPVGGETEFLYQETRVNAIEGRTVIWPAAFTHAHRGNQPIGSDKYIVTGWIEFME